MPGPPILRAGVASATVAEPTRAYAGDVGHRGRWLVAVAAMVVQFAVLYVPRAPSLPTGGLPLDKLVHVLVFAVPVVALVAAGAPRVWVVAVMAVHAPLSELLQSAVLADRSGEPGDVVADLVGVAIGAWLTRPGGWVARRANRRPGAAAAAPQP